MATVFRSRRETRPRSESPEDLLGHACTLLRLCAQDATIAALLLAMVAVGVLTQVVAGTIPLVLLIPVAGPFAISANFAVRARRTMLAALGAVRAGTGAPLDPGVPWTPVGLGSGVAPGVRDIELRRLLGAAYRCAELSWQAVVWGAVTAMGFLLWTTIMTAAG